MNTTKPHAISDIIGNLPFQLSRPLIGLVMDDADNTLLKYLNFLSNTIAIKEPTFFHVLPKFTSLDPFFEWEDKTYVRDEVLDKSIEHAMIKMVKSSLAKVNAIRPNYRLAHGDLLAAYLQAIKEVDPGIIVLGKRNDADYHSILAKNILRNSDKGLLLIPETSACTLNTILVSIDFSDNSGRALQTAIALNNSLKVKAKIICLNVYETPELNMYRITRTYSQYDSIVKGNISDAFENFLQKYIPNDREAVEFDFVKKDMPGFGRYIMKYANANYADLIVMGTQGHSKAHYMFLGSTTEKVLGLNKNMPVLVVK